MVDAVAAGAAPLDGRRVAIPRPADARSSVLADLIRALGGEPMELPVIGFEPAPAGGALDAALAASAAYDWIVFTSATAVNVVAGRLAADASAAGAMIAARIAAVGPATAAALTALIRTPDFVPGDHQAATLGREILAGSSLVGQRMLLPAADIASPALAEALRDRGADVSVVTAYRTVPGSGLADLGRALLEGGADALFLTSSSTATYLADWLEAHGASPALPDAAPAPAIFCIGPATAATAARRGFRITGVAAEHTGAGLVRALAEWSIQQPRSDQSGQ